MEEKKTVKAWAMVFKYESIVVPQIFATKTAAKIYHNRRAFKENFAVVPCTITYEVPKH